MGEVDNAIEQIQLQVGYLEKIDELVGDELHNRLILNLDKREPEDHEESVIKDKSDLLIRLSQIIQGYGFDEWSPLVKARFEKGLDDLEKLLQ